MTATKTRTSIWSAQTLTAGAGNTTSSAIDLSSGYGATVDIKFTNGGTGPSVAAQCQIQVATDWNSGSPTLWTNYGGAITGSITSSAVISQSVTIPFPVAALRLVAGSNVTQNVTIDADISNVTGI